MGLINLKTVFRLFLNNKLVFSLCVIGLSAGFAVFITIFMHYRFEHSFDKTHTNAKNIYRMHAIYGTDDGYMNKYATTDNGYGPSLKQDLPEVIDYVRILTYQSERIISYTPKNGSITKYREPHVFMVDSNFFSFFDYKLKVGSKHDVLNKPNTMVISESAAKKYFGDKNPLGKSLRVSTNGEPFKCEITGIFNDVPDNSNLQFNFLLSMGTQKQVWQTMDNSWNYAISYTYLHLVDNTDTQKLEDQIMEVFFKRSGFVANSDLNFDMELIHFYDIHLNEPLQWEHEIKGNRLETKYLLGIAIVIILISWLNYMNISTSLAKQRNNNTRIKLIHGAGKTHLIFQFIYEAFFINLISVCIAIYIILLVAPQITTFFQHGGIDFIFNDQFTFTLTVISIIVIGTVLSGIISAIFFFINNPDLILNPNIKSSGARFKQVMVVAQFTTAIMLIIGTILVYKQVQYLRSLELGVEVNQMIVIKSPTGGDANPQGLEKIRQTVTNNPSIINISAGSDIPGQFVDMGYMINRTSIDPPVHEITDGGSIDFDYVETLDLKLAAGVDFDKKVNPEFKVLINEEMAKLLKFNSPEDAVGKQIQLPEVYQNKPVTIIGVLKNYRQQSPIYPFKPVFFFCQEGNWLRYNYFVIHYNGNTKDVLSYLNNKWIETFPASSFDYYFLKDHYEKQYAGNTRFGNLFGILSILAIIIAALGLLGLSINVSQQRIKEIGIRKVNGAKTKEILALLNGDFLKWIALSFFIACPLAWVGMNQWLENFAYKTELSWWIFALAGIIAMGITLLTVTIQSWRAATRNPVDSLRYE